MTFHGAMGLVYIGAIIIAAFSFAIIVTMKSRKIINLENENFYLLIVATCLLLINILYFLIDYYSIIINYYRSGGVIRVLDIWLAISMQFAWFMLLKEILFIFEFKIKTLLLNNEIKFSKTFSSLVSIFKISLLSIKSTFDSFKEITVAG